MELPHRIMTCHGYRFPKLAYHDWDNVAGEIRLRGASDRRILMDLSYGHLPEGEQAVRLVIEDANRSYEPDELPPIQSLPSSASGEPSR